jgi:hypothetical protein
VLEPFLQGGMKMVETKLDERVSTSGREISEIARMNEPQLKEYVGDDEGHTTSEQLREAKIRVEKAHHDAKAEYLKGKTGVWRLLNNVLYFLNIRSPEKDLQRKKDNLLKLKAALNSDIRTVREVVEGGYKEIIECEKKKLAMDILIGRKERAFEDESIEYESINRRLRTEEVDPVQQSQLECEVQETYMNSHTLNREVNDLKCKYLLTHDRIERLSYILSGEQKNMQMLVQTKYDLESQIQEINIMMKRGVSPVKILNSMEKGYSVIERCESIKNGILKHSYEASDALSEVRVVTSSIAEENKKIYRENAELAVKNSDNVQLRYAALKQRGK